MDQKEPLRIVLIEDDVSMCRQFVECANSRTDIIFVGMTGRSEEGFQLVVNKIPEAVILDLELSWGEGSGYDFLDKFFKTEFSIRPIIVITTQNRNSNVHTLLHEQYALDWIFCKSQEGYNPEMVIRHLLRFRSLFSKRSSGMELKTLESPEELQNRIMCRIRVELNAFGISVRFKGRKIVEEAIYMLISRDGKDSDRVFNDLARARRTHYNNIVRNIQNAINDAWDNTDDIDAMMKHYTAPVRKDAGGPSPTEFIHYYADKIRRDM